MNYTVVWTPTAEKDLAAVWLKAEDRQAITSAADTIDRLLGQNPEGSGDVRFDSVRSLVIPPLGVDYEVMAEDRLVYALSVWSTLGKRPDEAG
jgi:plasmid stabilization system protein ParE